MDNTFLGINADQVFIFGLPLVFAMISIEVLVSSLHSQQHYDRADTLGTLGMFFGNAIVVFLTKALSFGVFVYCHQFRVFNFSESLPGWLVLIIALVSIDFVFYVFHRTSHRVRYGLKENVNTNDPFKITLYEWRRMWSDLKTTQSFREVLGYIFGPPDWKPNTRS